MTKTAPTPVYERINVLRAACTCAEQVVHMNDTKRREVLKETQKILGCEEKEAYNG